MKEQEKKNDVKCCDNEDKNCCKIYSCEKLLKMRQKIGRDFFFV